MNYRTKRLIKRILIGAAIVVGVLAALFLIVYFYIGRYQIFTDEGVVFSESALPEESAAAWTLGPGGAALVTGDPISIGSAEDDSSFPARDVNGILYDFEDVAAGNVLSSYDFSQETANMIVLEMRKSGQDLNDSTAVLSFLSSAKENGVRTAALISCLDDSAYALAHQSLGLAISGGALYMDSNGNYWLNPLEEDIQDYLADKITDLYNLGFDEVILDHFEIPSGAGTQIDTGDSTLDDLLIQAYNNLLRMLPADLSVGLFIEDPYEGHPCMDTAKRLYVCYQNAATAASYAQLHSADWLVFVTNSHDTRFDEYGKIYTTREFTFTEPDEEENNTGNTEIDTVDAQPAA